MLGVNEAAEGVVGVLVNMRPLDFPGRRSVQEQDASGRESTAQGACRAVFASQARQFESIGRRSAARMSLLGALDTFVINGLHRFSSVEVEKLQLMRSNFLLSDPSGVCEVSRRG